MKDSEKLSLQIYGIILSVRDTLSLPTHKTLEKTLYYSLALLLCSIVSTLTGFYTFVSWQGCLLCNVLLIILLWIERSENDALLRMYKSAKVSTRKALNKAKEAGSTITSDMKAVGSKAHEKKPANKKSNTKGKSKQKTGKKSKR